MAVKRRQILSYRSRDGFNVDSLLTTPSASSDDDLHRIPVIINIHGVLGNFLARGTPIIFPSAMLEKGYSTLSINTRMAFLGQIMGTGIFEKAADDVECSVETLRKEGFENIYILGYSMGANIAVDYMAAVSDPSVKGLILEGCSYSLPESQKKRLDRWGSIPSYDDIYKKAQSVLKPDPETSKNDQMFVIYRAWGDSFNPSDVEIFTYKTWWFMRGPSARRAKTCDIIGGISVPVLFINGADDDIVFAGEPEKLKSILNDSGNKSVDIEYIPGAGHDCMENAEASADVIDRWIRKLEKGGN
ncbi:MAG: alpha/beta hydrolase family protein [Thermodesulfobacteriota bacterium]